MRVRPPEQVRHERLVYSYVIYRYRRTFKITLDLAAQNIFSAVERLFLNVGEGAKAGSVNFIEYTVYFDLQLIAFTAVDLGSLSYGLPVIGSNISQNIDKVGWA